MLHLFIWWENPFLVRKSPPTPTADFVYTSPVLSGYVFWNCPCFIIIFYGKDLHDLWWHSWLSIVFRAEPRLTRKGNVLSGAVSCFQEFPDASGETYMWLMMATASATPTMKMRWYSPMQKPYRHQLHTGNCSERIIRNKTFFSKMEPVCPSPDLVPFLQPAPSLFMCF